MSKIKLKTVNAYKANQKNVLPLVGIVQFDEQAVIEVDEQFVDALIEIMPELSLFNPDEKDEEKEIKPKVEENDLGKGDEGGQINPQTNENDILGASATQKVADKKSPEEIEAALKEKSVADLKEIVAQYPQEETKELKKKEQYIAYLVTKLS